MRVFLAIAALWALVHCSGDETVTGYGGGASQWLLVEIDGRPYGARATLDLSEQGKLSGAAPCNRYVGEQSAPYPWFAAENVAATRRACEDLEAENLFLQSLADMTLSEVAGDTLILSNAAGREMLFEAIEPQPE